MADSKLIQASRHRKKLRTLGAQIPLLIQKIIQPRHLTKGLIYKRKRKCGNQNCKCAQGNLHSSEVLSFSKNGKEQSVYLTKLSMVEIEKIKERVSDYKQFRISRAKIVYCYKQLIGEINGLEECISIFPGENRKKEGIR